MLALLYTVPFPLFVFNSNRIRSNPTYRLTSHLIYSERITIMAQSRAPVYLGLAGLSAGAFYLYRAGGDPKTATQELKGMLSPP